MAGTAAAKNNNIGAVGMAPGARLWAVKVLGNDGSGWMNWIIGGIDYVTANADQIDVANMSLGCKCDSNALDAALTNSVAAGVTFAVAAGNSMEDASTFSPANHPDVITVSAMADFDGVGGGLTDTTVTFGICTEYEDDSFACFSNYGEDVNIAAPGVNILSTALGGGTATMSGTSMASPHVAGAAALHIASNGKPTNATEALAVRAALVAAGTDQNHVDGFTGDPNYAEPLLNVATLSGSGGGTVPTNNAPNADFSFSTSLLEASFTDLSSDSDGSIASWDWNFGDGNNSTSQNPIHTYLFSGTYSVMLTVMDNEGATNSVSNNVTVSDGSGGSTTTVSVDSITYATAGGKNGDKHLNVTVALLDDLLNPVSGASVSITLNNTTADESWMGTGGITGAGGTVTYTLKNAPSGMYTTTVTDVTASGLTWDNVTPANFFDK